ncbi:hypothetical protein NGTWS1803_17240 [Mycolicibacterium cyprinidarum]|nr:hypothetical protein NGTWS1803_17240 [Mycolicibacterium sp. NGTWS1803]
MTQSEGQRILRERRRDVALVHEAVTVRGTLRLDPSGLVAHFCAGAQALFGYSESEVVGHSTSMFFLAEDRASGLAERELATAREYGRFEFDGWRVRKDGHRFQAHVVITAIRDEVGTVVGFDKVVQDLDADRARQANAFYSFLEMAPDAMVIVDDDGRILLANAQADRMFGYSRENLLGLEVEMLMPPRFRAEHIRYRNDFFAAPKIRSLGADLDLRGIRSDGSEFPVRLSLGPLTIGERQYVSATIQDVTELRAARQAEARLAAVVQCSDDAIISMAPNLAIETWNPGACRLLGHEAGQIIGQPVHSLMPVESQELFDAALNQTRDGGHSDSYDTLWCRADGTLVDVTVNVSSLRDTNGKLDGYSAIARDITTQVEAQRQLERLAHFDTLTGLANRAETMSRLESALECSRIPGLHLGVLFCDIDNFKMINDTWGHAVGDVVLATLADRIRGSVRHGDTVGRTGGDEILVLLPGLHGVHELEQIAKKIRWRVADPIDHCGTSIYSTVSIGATLAVPGESMSRMTARADEAMYKAKQAGRDTVAYL